MKRFFFAGTVVLVLLVLIGLSVRYFTAKKDSLLELNIEALAEQEAGIYGYCKEKDGACLYQCPKCKEWYEAVGHGGGSYDMGGSCVKCNEEASN